MNHSQYESQVQLFLDHELTPQEKRAFEEHLRTCSECRHQLNSLVQVTSLIRGMRQHRVPIGFNYDVLKELGFDVIPFSWRVASVAAAMAVGGWIGLVSLWVRRPGVSGLTGLVKAVVELPRQLDILGKLLQPIWVLLRASATVLRSLGGFHVFTALCLLLLVALFAWWLVNDRLRPARIVSLI